MRKAFIMTLLSVLLTGNSSQAGFEEGWEAYKRGDHATALREWRPLATAGNAEAQFQLALMYEMGLGVSQNRQEAIALYRSAETNYRRLANQGDLAAQVSLGNLYEKGLGVSRDYHEAALWYSRAADQGYWAGQMSLAHLYRFGLGVPKDYVLAYMWFNLAASSDGGDFAGGRREDLAKQMTASQIAEAQRLAREWAQKKE
jgi:TPR repeat protein